MMTTANSNYMENDFLNKLKEIVLKNISNEQFGVSELANEVNMSRSNLLRKLKKLNQLSVSQFIRQIRLQHAMEILKQTSSTVSEVSYQVGFSSISYFIKCFHDHYGFPPGEIGKMNSIEDHSSTSTKDFQSRQLAAIMFTDIEGSTALMQKDELKALQYRSKHREVFNRITQKFNGKILQYYGDGTLSTFSSAIEAVRCGIEMQLAFLEEPQIPVRIGIHSGDIILTADDIIGDGVNVASRIESLAVTGSVFISEKVYDEVKNQSGILTKSMGFFELKNVDKPMEVFAITNSGLIVPVKNEIAGKVKIESKNNHKGSKADRKRPKVNWIFIFLTPIIIGYFIYSLDIFNIKSRFALVDHSINKKSIAVLPFKNDSNDSTNVYIVNGLMESILNNLQKIEDLRVISRTSVEKYRNSSKTIPEIAKELNVKYLVEGSGQKIGNQILLNIQLIESPEDNHLWAEQYNREANDIFKLQMDVAKKIADEIQVIITPEEQKRINKIPTDNVIAYDYFLKGNDIMNNGKLEGFEEAIEYFEKAIENDEKFALAYASTAIAYYFLDMFQTEKEHLIQVNNYADKALFIDAQLPEAMVAKALFYMGKVQYELAVSYFEKALEFNPNSALALNFLSDYYANKDPNTEKYLEYALKGIGLDIATHDSATASFVYLHLSNAFMQSGFIAEAEKYINKSLDYNPGNLFSEYVKAYILLARDGDLAQTKDRLIETLKKDSTRLDVVQEIGKIYYYMRDYENAYKYYKPFIEIREANNLNIFKSENAKIGVVLSKVGLKVESKKYLENYMIDAKNNYSIYRDLNLSLMYSYQGDTEKAIEHLRLFAEQDNYYYWIILFVKIEPLIDNLKNNPEYMKLLNDIEVKFWKKHKQIKASLEEKQLL